MQNNNEGFELLDFDEFIDDVVTISDCLNWPSDAVSTSHANNICQVNQNQSTPKLLKNTNSASICTIQEENRNVIVPVENQKHESSSDLQKHHLIDVDILALVPDKEVSNGKSTCNDMKVKNKFYIRFKNLSVKYESFPLLLFSAIGNGHISEMEQILYATYDRDCKIQWKLPDNQVFTRAGSKSLYEFYVAYLNSVPDMMIEAKDISTTVRGNYTILTWTSITQGTFVYSSYFEAFFASTYYENAEALKRKFNPRKNEFMRFKNKSTVNVIINNYTNRIIHYFGNTRRLTGRTKKL